MGGILDGVRVIDAASFIAAPAAATVLADFGAEVIKVEPPGAGDPYRNALRGPGYPDCHHLHDWFVDNRNKKGIAVDLKSEEGRRVLYRLVETADVFITNMPLGARERLRIRWEDLEPVNGRLVYAAASAYGETGPEAGRTGFDSTVWWARSGMQDLIKPLPDSAPARSLPGMGDHPTASALFGAIMLGLFRRERTGKGGKVSTSLLANGAWSNAVVLQAILCGGSMAHRPPREESLTPLNNYYRTRDGRWIQLIMITGQGRYGDLMRCLGRPDLAEDPRYATPEARAKNARVLIAEIDSAFAAADAATIRAALTGAGFTFGETHESADVLHDRQMVEGGALRAVDDPTVGARYVVDTPFFVEGSPKVAPAPAPLLGEHTDEVLRGAGYDDATIAALREAGAVA